MEGSRTHGWLGDKCDQSEEGGQDPERYLDRTYPWMSRATSAVALVLLVQARCGLIPDEAFMMQKRTTSVDQNFML